MWHVPKENLCCTSVLSDSQAVKRSENLAPLGTTRSESVFSMGTDATCPFIMSEQSPRSIKLRQYMHEVTIKHCDKLKIQIFVEEAIC